MRFLIQFNEFSDSILMFFVFISFQRGLRIHDLFEDLRDGHNLISLLEVLSGETFVSCPPPYSCHDFQGIFTLIEIQRELLVLSWEILDAGKKRYCKAEHFWRNWMEGRRPGISHEDKTFRLHVIKIAKDNAFQMRFSRD